MPDAPIIALIPAYKPLPVLVDLAPQLREHEMEVVIVDDGSGEEYRNIFDSSSFHATVLQHSENMGKGKAIKTGLRYISEHYPKDAVVVTVDADGQHRIEDVLRVCKAALHDKGCLILGSREFGKGVPARSRFGNIMTRLVFKLATGVSVRDTQTGLRAFSAELIPFMINIAGDRYEYEMNVLLESSRHGIPISEVDIGTIYIDNNSSSHFNAIKDSYRIYKNIFKFLLAHSTGFFADIIKFAASSLSGFIIDYTAYLLLAFMTKGWGPISSVAFSNITARAISASANYYLNRKYVFRSNESVAKTATQYFTLAGLILIGNTFLLEFLVNYLHINKYAAKIITEFMFFALSWIAQRFIIFRKKETVKAKRS